MAGFVMTQIRCDEKSVTAGTYILRFYLALIYSSSECIFCTCLSIAFNAFAIHYAKLDSNDVIVVVWLLFI
jgi:hypothetical protein